MTQELAEAKQAIEDNCLEGLSRNMPKTLGILYDLNLLPEQLERGSEKWNLMMRIVIGMAQMTQHLKGNEGHLWPVRIGNNLL